MKHWMLAVGLALMLAARPAGAQTRVAVVVGFGVPHPFVTGVVVVGRPRPHYPRRTYVYRAPLFVERPHVARYHHRHHYRRDYDDDE
jgi:hypothetical protein